MKDKTPAYATPADVHRAWLLGILTNGEFVFQLSECGADDETVRREVPDSSLLEDYFEYVSRKKAGLPAGFVFFEGGKIGVSK